MKVINHIAVYSRDPARLERFYRNYFYASRDGGCGGPKTGCQSFFLRFDDEVRLEVIARPGLRDRPPEPAVGLAYLAFSVGSESEVDSLTAALVKGGQPMIAPPHKTGNGRYESCVADPDGNRIRITV